jgi:C4-dicarboxylate transporter DctQ subunit
MPARTSSAPPRNRADWLHTIVNTTLLQFSLLAAVILAFAVLRSYHLNRNSWTAFFRFWGILEMGAVTLLISGLIFFGILQILLRNFFHQGIIWADPLMRHIVLWLGCLGGTLASARMQHINIDIFSRILSGTAKRFRDRIVFGATAAASSALGFAALRLVIDEKAYGERAFLNIETWVLQSILPLAFFIIAYRSAYNAITPAKRKEGDE